MNEVQLYVCRRLSMCTVRMSVPQNIVVGIEKLNAWHFANILSIQAPQAHTHTNTYFMHIYGRPLISSACMRVSRVDRGIS